MNKVAAVVLTHLAAAAVGAGLAVCVATLRKKHRRPESAPAPKAALVAARPARPSPARPLGKLSPGTAAPRGGGVARRRMSGQR
jgi:hypothetical protein